ncbi:MAG: hypothetical protein DA328_04505 [Nitrososphaeraceae archaeon]|nr:hypothetical protein [Nitrososphaeraceae archaeon]
MAFFDALFEAIGDSVKATADVITSFVEWGAKKEIERNRSLAIQQTSYNMAASTKMNAIKGSADWIGLIAVVMVAGIFFTIYMSINKNE